MVQKIIVKHFANKLSEIQKTWSNCLGFTIFFQTEIGKHACSKLCFCRFATSTSLNCLIIRNSPPVEVHYHVTCNKCFGSTILHETKIGKHECSKICFCCFATDTSLNCLLIPNSLQQEFLTTLLATNVLGPQSLAGLLLSRTFPGF